MLMTIMKMNELREFFSLLYDPPLGFPLMNNSIFTRRRPHFLASKMFPCQ